MISHDWKDNEVRVEITNKGIIIHTTHETRTGEDFTPIIRLLDSTRGFLQITSFIRAHTLSHNIATFKTVPIAIRNLLGNQSPKVVGYWMIGHWAEPARAADAELDRPMAEACARASGDVQTAMEYAWFFLQPREIDDARWAEAACKIARDNDQNAFVLRLNDRNHAVLSGQDGARWATLETPDAIFAMFQRLAVMRATSTRFGSDALRSLEALTKTDPATPPTTLYDDGQFQGGVSAQINPAEVQFHLATTDNIASSMMFAALGILKG